MVPRKALFIFSVLALLESTATLSMSVVKACDFMEGDPSAYCSTPASGPNCINTSRNSYANCEQNYANPVYNVAQYTNEIGSGEEPDYTTTASLHCYTYDVCQWDDQLKECNVKISINMPSVTCYNTLTCTDTE